MDVLDLLTSKNRCKIVKILTAEKKRTSELISDLGISKTAVSQHISRLKKDGLIIKDGDRFKLTGKGRLFELFLRKLEETINIVERYPDFWILHDTESIPESARLKIGEIHDYTVLKGEKANFLSHCSVFTSALRDAKFVRAVFSVILPEFSTTLSEISGNVDISLIVTDEVVKFLNDEILQNANVFINNSVRFVGLTTDKKLCLGLYLLNGEFDISAILVSDSPSAIKWGLELFEYFKKSSKQLTKLNQL